MKTKLDMAMQMIVAEVRRVGITSIDNDKVIDAWNLADAMQAEVDKREDKKQAERIKIYADAFMNCEIQVVDEDGTCRITTRQKELDRDEWQPDWSQAPDDACCWFIGGSSWDLKAYWSKYIPCYKSETTQTTWQGNGMIEAPSFGYTGDWRNSLRKRPK